MNWRHGDGTGDVINVASEISEIRACLSNIDDTLDAASHGATLRDMMAMAALKGVLSNHRTALDSASGVARNAYAMADAMILEREK